MGVVDVSRSNGSDVRLRVLVEAIFPERMELSDKSYPLDVVPFAGICVGYDRGNQVF